MQRRKQKYFSGIWKIVRYRDHVRNKSLWDKSPETQKFYKLYVEQGYGIWQIAEMCKLDDFYIYKVIDSIMKQYKINFTKRVERRFENLYHSIFGYRKIWKQIHKQHKAEL